MTTFKGSREAVVACMMDLAETDPKIVFVSADSVKAARATAFVEKYPKRYFEAGIAEQTAVAIAAGLATCGLKPYLITYGGFITMRACEQVRTFVAYPHLDVKFVGLNGGLIGGEREGVTHQSLEDLAIMRSIPGMTVVSPADGNETYFATKAVSRIKGPAYIRVGSGKEHDIFPSDIGFELGKIRIVKKYGSDVALFTHGFIMDRVIKAAEELNAAGVKATVAEVATLKPVDVDGIVAVLKDCETAVSVEDHTVIGALGSLIAETSADHYPVSLIRVGLQDVFPESGPADALADAYGLSVADIVAAGKKAAAKKRA
ncbi:MAG: transketolase C-terminal domain-containing protein [Treponemataceae bacterium]